MRKLYSLFGIMLLSLAAFAGTVSEEQALGEARAFLLRNVQGKSGLKLAPARFSLSTSASNESCYIFNVGEQDGFVVVSADDRTPAILGYAEQGSFDYENCPEPLKAFLAGYADQIRLLSDNKAQNLRPRLVTIKRAIDPLIKTKWDQEAPYNASCPKFLNGEVSSTGCVATTLSQIMKYYEWPSATKAEIPAYDCRDWKIDDAGTLAHVHVEAIPSGTKFDWKNMQLVYNDSETDEQKTAVATLMTAVGAAVKMDYADGKNGGSSASDAIIPSALQNYFDYSKNAIYIQRENYLMEEWNELLYNELQAKRPVIMGGQSSGGGHAFVVDGYSGDDYFHINWGWGGFCNGYFLLSIVNPGSSAGSGASSSSDGYSFNQDAVIGIEPEHGQAVTISKPVMLTQLVSAEGHEIVANFYSQVDGNNVFNFGLCYLSDDGTLVPIDGYQESQTLSYGVGYENAKFPVKGLADGTYKILPAGKLKNDKVWKSSLNPSISYVETVVKDGEVTLKVVQPVVDLQVKGIRPQNTPTVNKTLAVDVDIENKGDEFYAPIYLYAENVAAGFGMIVAKLGVTLPSSSTTTVTFFYKPMEEGDFQLSVTTDGKDRLGAYPLKVVKGSNEKATIEVTGLKVNGSEAGEGFAQVYGLLAGEITVKNTSAVDYDDDICFICQTHDPATYAHISSDYYFEAIQVPAGAEKTFPFEFSNVEPNKLQWVIIGSADGQSALRGEQNDIVVFLPGAIVYKSDGTREGQKIAATFQVPESVVAVEFTGTDGLAEVQGNNPNTLYFFSPEAQVPTSLTRNVVRGDAAANVEITDGFPFVSPRYFVAENIRYTRSFQSKVDMQKSSGWETIALPFDVEAIETNVVSGEAPQPIIGEFIDESGKNAIFKACERIKSSTPYLIGFPVGSGEVSAIFMGSNAQISEDFDAILTGVNLKMQGVDQELVIEGAMTINAAGTDFVQGDGKVAPFRAYFAPTANATKKFTYVHISAEAVTGVESLQDVGSQPSKWYTISGQRLQRPAKAGIYVSGGKKIVVK